MMNNFSQPGFIFWQRWLVITSLFFAGVSVALALWGGTFLFLPYTKLLAKVFWNSNYLPADVEPFLRFVYGPMGGTMACSYILLAYIAAYPFKQKQSWARNAIVVSFGVWFLVDSTACLRFEMYPQLYIINAFSVLVKALPLMFTWKYFSATAK